MRYRQRLATRPDVLMVAISRPDLLKVAMTQPDVLMVAFSRIGRG